MYFERFYVLVRYGLDEGLLDLANRRRIWIAIRTFFNFTHDHAELFVIIRAGFHDQSIAL
jgi:hypothetical protein